MFALVYRLTPGVGGEVKKSVALNCSLEKLNARGGSVIVWQGGSVSTKLTNVFIG